MAEWGKGDDRWIVEDRKDGTNVNAWHWTEKDCMAWSSERFSQLFDQLSLVNTNDAKATISKVDSVEGEAFLNVRKKKLIPSYELSVTASFTGTVTGANQDTTVNGKVVLPYIAEENHDEDPEIKVSIEEDTPASLKMKQAILEHGKQYALHLHAFPSRTKGVHAAEFTPRSCIWACAAASATPRDVQAIIDVVKTYVAEFHAGKPAGHQEAPSPQPTPKSAQPSAQTRVNSSSNQAPAAAPVPKDSTKRGTRSIVIKDTFYASARDIFEVFTNEGRIKAFTQSDASVKADVGSKFTMFGGSIEGVQRELLPGKRIVQDWRFNTWPPGLYSKVVIEIAEPEPGHTTLTMTQEGIPEEDQYGNRDVVGTTENGWRNLIIYKIKAVFGYGL